MAVELRREEDKSRGGQILISKYITIDDRIIKQFM